MKKIDIKYKGNSLVSFRDSHVSYIKLSMIVFFFALSAVLANLIISDGRWISDFNYAFFPEEAIRDAWGRGLIISDERVIEIMKKFPLNRKEDILYFFISNSFFILGFFCIFYLIP